MKGLLIYNSFFGKNNKLYYLVEDLVRESKALNISLDLKGNEDFLIHKDIEADCDFILFWDKDIYLARAFEEKNVPVFNSSEAIRISDSKIETHFKVKDELKIPKTIVGPFSYFEKNYDENYLDKVLSYLGEKIVVKEDKGSFGMQVYLAKGKEELKKILQSLGNKNFLMEEFVESSKGRDLRVNVVGSKVIGAMERSNDKDFRSNISLGGKAKYVKCDDEACDMALKACEIVGTDFAGVDLLYGEEGYLFSEINSNVNYLSFNKASGLNMGRSILEYIGGKL